METKPAPGGVIANGYDLILAVAKQLSEDPSGVKQDAAAGLGQLAGYAKDIEIEVPFAEATDTGR